MAASNNVIIEFLTRFKDWGVKACLAATSRLVVTVKKATGVLAQMGSSLGELGGKFVVKGSQN